MHLVGLLVQRPFHSRFWFDLFVERIVQKIHQPQIERHVWRSFGESQPGAARHLIQQIGRVIDYLRDRGDMAIVLVEQYFDFAYDHADEFVILRRGEVISEGTKATLSRDDLVAAVSV